MSTKRVTKENNYKTQEWRNGIRKHGLPNVITLGNIFESYIMEICFYHPNGCTSILQGNIDGYSCITEYYKKKRYRTFLYKNGEVGRWYHY